ncbi:hypothetical protein [Cellulomonas xiejunii]|uniref:hypothetical protein n=1 Tax=Cellulomonas xiejunii TaxID=2968083 RepID=UPI001D0E2DA7|nr:hypothetical protein [Cellulomonas xiejunii]MCC2316287.1 hypothetical protein [Cellulomonas xiejunii]
MTGRARVPESVAPATTHRSTASDAPHVTTPLDAPRAAAPDDGPRATTPPDGPRATTPPDGPRVPTPPDAPPRPDARPGVGRPLPALRHATEVGREPAAPRPPSPTGTDGGWPPATALDLVTAPSAGHRSVAARADQPRDDTVGEVVAASPGQPAASADAPAADSPADLAGLADRLWDHLEHRLRRSLLLERERRGVLPDL